MAPKRSTLCAATLSVCAQLATAQCPESLSFMSGLPTGMSLAADAAVPFDATQVYVTDPGFGQVPPPEWPAIGATVHFRLNDILANCTAATLDVNAMSLGQDFLLVDDATGVIEIPVDRWAALNFSVAKTAQGCPGSLVEQEAAHADGPGADLFSYAFLGSALPDELMGNTQRTHDSREIDLGDGAAAQREIDAVDQYMPLYRLDAALVATMPPTPSIFFTLSAATVGSAPPAWFGLTPPSAASILRVDWHPSVGVWSCPYLFKPYFDLGLSINDDIDALALDLERARIVFSTTNLNRDQLEFVSCVQDAPTPKTLKETQPDATEKKVTEKMGLLDDDDVDGVCGIDPSIRRRTGALGTSINTMFYVLGTPTAPVFPPANTLQASAIRFDTPFGPAFYSQVVGWPPFTGHGPGIALLTFSPAGQLNPLFAIQGGFRNDVMPIHCGDPFGVTWRFPPNWVLHMPILEFELRWFVADINLIELQDAHPLRIRL